MEEDRMVRAFPPTIQFGNGGQREKFNKLMSGTFATMKYLSIHSPESVGLLNEVNM